MDETGIREVLREAKVGLDAPEEILQRVAKAAEAREEAEREAEEAERGVPRAEMVGYCIPCGRNTTFVILTSYRDTRDPMNVPIDPDPDARAHQVTTVQIYCDTCKVLVIEVPPEHHDSEWSGIPKFEEGGN